ncbi:MAG: DUF1289 domain-containing protein [Hyphomicrobiaceae bacterium]|nr:DUF1289 domain-containing protein [Hyphomicrobiaceae bacterium]
MQSPCINICVIDDTAGLCVGCGRTILEIAGWAKMTDAQHTNIMSGLPQRLATAGLPILAPREQATTRTN